MTKYRVIVTMIFLLGSIEARQEFDQKKAMIERGASLSRGCSYSIELAGKGDEIKDLGTEKKLVDRVSFQKLFREGRFVFNNLTGRANISGRDMVIISFSPAKALPVLPDEDDKWGRTLNQAMNSLQGAVWIDKATGGIARLEGHSAKMQWLSEWPAWVSFTMSMDQKLVENTWLPWRGHIVVKGTFKYVIPFYYPRDVNCDK